MPGSSYELYYPHMMPICARDDSYGSVMRIFCMSFCLRCRAGFGRLPALSGDFWTLSPPLRVQISPENFLIVQKSPDNAARVRISPENAPPSNTAPERGRRLPFRSDRLRSGLGKTREGVKKSVLNLEKQSVST